jgi:hypothetical protein
MKTNPIFALVAAGLFAAVPYIVHAEESSSDEAQEYSGMRGWGMMHGRGMWREFHEKMAKMAKTHEAELDALVKEIDTAKGEKKVEALAATVKKMVEQRKAMHALMSECQSQWKKEREKATSEESATPSASPTKGRKDTE